MRRTSIMVCHKQGAPRKSQGYARDFWGKGETVLRRLRIAFRQAAATQMLFRRGGAEENLLCPEHSEGNGVVLKIAGFRSRQLGEKSARKIYCARKNRTFCKRTQIVANLRLNGKE